MLNFMRIRSADLDVKHGNGEISPFMYAFFFHAHCANNAQLSFHIDCISSAGCVQSLNQRNKRDLVKYIIYHATRPVPFDLSRVLLDDFIVIQIFIIMFTKSRHWLLFLDIWQQSTSLDHISLRYIPSAVIAVIPQRSDTFLYLRT
jgi:uncharacterized membrane protein